MKYHWEKFKTIINVNTSCVHVCVYIYMYLLYNFIYCTLGFTYMYITRIYIYISSRVMIYNTFNDEASFIQYSNAILSLPFSPSNHGSSFYYSLTVSLFAPHIKRSSVSILLTSLSRTFCRFIHIEINHMISLFLSTQ